MGKRAKKSGASRKAKDALKKPAPPIPRVQDEWNPIDLDWAPDRCLPGTEISLVIPKHPPNEKNEYRLSIRCIAPNEFRVTRTVVPPIQLRFAFFATLPLVYVGVAYFLLVNVEWVSGEIGIAREITGTVLVTAAFWGLSRIPWRRLWDHFANRKQRDVRHITFPSTDDEDFPAGGERDEPGPPPEPGPPARAVPIKLTPREEPLPASPHQKIGRR